MRFKQYISFLLGWPLSIAALYYLSTLFLSQWQKINRHSLHIDWTLVVASIISCALYFVFRVIAWEQLLPEHTDHIKKTSLYWMLSELQRFLPGNIWGQIARIKYFSHRIPEKRTLLKLLTVESYYIVIASAVVALLALPKLFTLLPLWQWSILAGALIIGIATILIMRRLPLIGRLFTDMPFKKRVTVLIPMSMSFLWLSFGSYLAIKSVAPVSMGDWITITGIFSVSLLIGYGSIITPMGLGIREAALVYFLHFFMPLGSATLAAIAARIISIVAEGMILSFFALWQKGPTGKIEHWIGNHKYELLLMVFTLGYALYFSLATCAKQDTFFTGRFDLGNMDQVVWNSAHGHLFLFTDPGGTDIISRLAFHADVLLVDLAPLYWIWSDPKMLLIAQSLALASGAIWVYLIASHVLKRKSISFILALSYLLYPAIQFVNLYDFHMVSFAVPLFLAAWYAFLREKVWVSALFLALAGLTKENVWVAVGIFGFFLLFTRHKKWGTVLLLGSIGLFFFFVSYLIPATRGSKHFAIEYYSDFGDSPRSIILGFLTKPLTIIGDVFQFSKLEYLIQLFAPVGFLALVSPAYLLFALGDFMINLLSTNQNMTQLYYQYTTVITPFIFIAAIYGTKKIIDVWPQYSSLLGGYLLVSAVVCAGLFGPLPGSSAQNILMFEHALSYRSSVSAALDMIPPRATVAATNNLGAHLSQRDYIFTIPTGMDKAEYLAFLLTDESAQPSLEAQKQMVSALQQNSSYETLYQKQDFYLFKKK